MTWTVLDIETAPQARALAAPFPREGEQFMEKEHGSLKDPVKIAEWKAKQRANWEQEIAQARTDWEVQRVKEASLTPRLGRIVAVGFANSLDTCPTICVQTDEARERELVALALDVINSTIGNRLVTYNGHSFDIPFIHVRAAVLGVPVPYHAQAYCRRYSFDPHVDCRMVLSNWDMRGDGTLKEWCESFGIACDDDTSGADIWPMVQAGDVAGITKHCRSDIAQTATLARRLADGGLI